MPLCKCCNAPFDPARSWQTFCSAKCRSAYRTVTLTREEALKAIEAANAGRAGEVKEILTRRMKGDVEQG